MTQTKKEKSQKNLFLRLWFALGFPHKQATMREFVILIAVGLGGYITLHLYIPSNSSLSLFKIKSDDKRRPILEQISSMQEDIKNQENSILSLSIPNETIKNSSSISETKKNSSSSSETIKNPINPPEIKKNSSGLPEANDNSIIPTETNKNPRSLTENKKGLLVGETAKEWLKTLTNTNISNKEKRIIEDLAILLEEIQNKDIKDLKKDDIKGYIQLLIDTSKSLNKLEVTFEESLEQNLFWTDNGKWVEVVFWSLFGTLLYIIQQTAEYHLSSNKKVNVKVLVRRKPQYYYFIFQSPFTALVILWILSMANFNIAGIALALSNSPSEVLISLAFILGLFNRVANTQLNLIVASIFGDAWKRTVRKIEIQKRSEDEDIQSVIGINILSTDAYVEVSYGECADFDVLPDVKVKWSIISKPSAGIIDKSTGTYIAPPKGFYYEDAGLKKLKDAQLEDKNYTQDIIRAEREDEPDVSALVLVILVDQSPDERLEGFDLR